MTNFIQLCRLTREPELKHTQTQKAVATFGIAYDYGWGDNKKPVFIDCECWGQKAENVAQWLHKGSQIVVAGTISMDTWEDRNGGGKRSKLKLVVDSFSFAGPKDGATKRSASEFSGDEPNF